MAQPEGAPETEDVAPSRIRVREPTPRDTGSALKPLLASEALIEDLAPVEPSRALARQLVIGLGLVFAALGGLSLVGLVAGGRQGAYASFVLGALALAAGALPVDYRRRALAMVVLGGLALALGTQRLGPVHGLADDGRWAIARVLAGSLLPAALLFRSRYRAFKGARWLLGVGFLFAVPFVAHAVLALTRAAEMGIVQTGAALALLALVASLSGFMGAETTGASSATAGAILVALTVDLGLTAFAAHGGEAALAPIVASVVVVVGYGSSALLVALGLFQQLAARLGPAARTIDIRKPPTEPPRAPPSSPDWIGGGA